VHPLDEDGQFPCLTLRRLYLLACPSSRSPAEIGMESFFEPPTVHDSSHSVFFSANQTRNERGDLNRRRFVKLSDGFKRRPWVVTCCRNEEEGDTETSLFMRAPVLGRDPLEREFRTSVGCVSITKFPYALTPAVLLGFDISHAQLSIPHNSRRGNEGPPPPGRPTPPIALALLK